MFKLFAATPIRASLEELESRVLQLDEENTQLELVLQENLGKKQAFSPNIQVETLQEIIEDYEQRSRTQDAHIAQYIHEIAELKALCEELTIKNRDLRRANGVLKGKNHLVMQELERKNQELERKSREITMMHRSWNNQEVTEMMQRSCLSLSSCSTTEDFEEDLEEVTVETSLRESVKEKSEGLYEEFRKTIRGVSSEIKRLELERVEEKAETVTNFFNRTPVKAAARESGIFSRNLTLLKMKVMGTLGLAGVA